jgi:hypothetical protein
MAGTSVIISQTSGKKCKTFVYMAVIAKKMIK